MNKVIPQSEKTTLVMSPRQAISDQARQDAHELIRHERARQDAKWGEQDHGPETWLTVLGEEYGEACQGALRHGFGGHSLNEYLTEMVHVAAVSTAAIECVLRARLTEESEDYGQDGH